MSQIQCSNCKNYKVVSETKTYKLKVTVWSLIVGSLLYYLGYINESLSSGFIILLGVCLIGVGLIYLLLFCLHKEDRFKCKSCGYKWGNMLSEDGQTRSKGI